MGKMKKILLFAALLSFTFASRSQAAVVESDSNLHGILGALYALSASAELDRSDSAGKALTDASRLERYFRPGVPSGWDWKGVLVKTSDGARWVGLKTPDSQEVRRFLRLNAPRLEIFEADGRTLWVAGKQVWMRVRGEKDKGPNVELRVGRGGRPFFGAPGTAWFWGSPLLFTDASLRAALKARNGTSDPSLQLPASAPKQGETFKASPVRLPASFSVSGDEEDLSMSVGDVRVNPVPRIRND